MNFLTQKSIVKQLRLCQICSRAYIQNRRCLTNDNLEGNLEKLRIALFSTKSDPPIPKGQSQGVPLEGDHNITSVVNRVKMLLVTEMQKQRAKVQTKTLMVLSGFFLGGIIGIYFYGQDLLRIFTKGTAEVAKETLQHEPLQLQMQELVTTVVQTLLNDKDVMKNTATFLKEISENEETRNALVVLAVQILQDKETLKEAVQLATKVVLYLAKDPLVINEIAVLMTEVLKDERVNQSAATLIFELSKEEQVYLALVELTKRVLMDDSIQAVVSDLLSKSSLSVLEEKKVIEESKKFVAEVVADKTIHKAGGQALITTISDALKPHAKTIAATAIVITVAIFSLAQTNKSQ